MDKDGEGWGRIEEDVGGWRRMDIGKGWRRM